MSKKKKLILSTRVGEMEIQIFTLDELSQHFDIHVKTLRRYIKEKKLRATKIGRKYIVSAENLKRFVDGKG